MIFSVDHSSSILNIPTKVEPPQAPMRLKKFRKEETKTYENKLNSSEHRFKVNIHPLMYDKIRNIVVQ